jgi:hypothetical protein
MNKANIFFICSLIGCTTLIAVSGILQTHPGRRGSGPGPLGRVGLRPYPTPPPGPSCVQPALGRAGMGGPGRHLRHFPWPPVQLGTVPTASGRSGPGGPVITSATGPSPPCGRGGAHCAFSLLAGVGRCPLANSRGSAGLPVGAPDRRHASPLMSPQGAAVGWGPGPRLARPRVDHHQYRSTGCWPV